MRFLCLWFPSWPVQRQIFQDPTLASQAVAVHDAAPRRGRRIIACSVMAERRGLTPGAPLAEASALRRRGAAALHLFPHDPQADEEQLAQLAEYCERFGPMVGWRTTDDQHMAPASGPDCLLLDVTRIGRHFGGESALAARAVKAMGRRGLMVCAGLAGTIGAAWAAAHFDEQGQTAEPPHQSVVPAGQDQQAMKTRPPEALRLPPEPLMLMEQLGISRGHQLAALPRSAISSRLGFLPLKRCDQATGAASEAIVGYRAPIQFVVERRFEAPVRDRRAVEQTACRLAVELSQKLQAARRGAVQIECRLDSLEGQTTRLTVGLFEPTDESSHLQDVLRLQLETAQVENGVERVTLTAPQVAPIATRQQDLFGQHQAARGAAQLVDRLRQRLGEQQVVQPRLRADAQPERAFAYHKHNMGNATTTRSKPSPKLPAPLHRPLSLGQPQPLTVFSWEDEMPKQFSWNQQLVEVFRYWGPERIETGWWRGHSIRRDYFRIELRGGERLWIFQQMNTKQWFLHGWYC